jgi:hypothetical protein
MVPQRLQELCDEVCSARRVCHVGAAALLSGHWLFTLRRDRDARKPSQETSLVAPRRGTMLGI